MPGGICIPGDLLSDRVQYGRHDGEGLPDQLLHDVHLVPLRVSISVPAAGQVCESCEKYSENAWLLSIAALPWTILSILLVIAAVYISFFMNPDGLNLAVFLWGMMGFGIVAYLNSFFFQRAFQRIDPEKLEVKHEAPKEAVFIDEEHRSAEVFFQESSYSNPDWNRQAYPGKGSNPAAGGSAEKGVRKRKF